MAIKTTTWSPDTCDCIINYDWDSDLSEDQRIHNVSAIIKECSAHLGLTTQAHYNAVLQENYLKNFSVATVTELYPDAVVDWKFDDQRKLVLTVQSATQVDSVLLVQKLGPNVKINIV